MKGVSSEAPDQEGNTPLHYASKYGHLDLCKFFIEQGCSAARKNFKGLTPYEVTENHIVRQYLLPLQLQAERELGDASNGADINPPNSSGRNSYSNGGGVGFSMSNLLGRGSGSALPTLATGYNNTEGVGTPFSEDLIYNRNYVPHPSTVPCQQQQSMYNMGLQQLPPPPPVLFNPAIPLSNSLPPPPQQQQQPMLNSSSVNYPAPSSSALLGTATPNINNNSNTGSSTPTYYVSASSPTVAPALASMPATTNYRSNGSSSSIGRSSGSGNANIRNFQKFQPGN